MTIEPDDIVERLRLAATKQGLTISEVLERLEASVVQTIPDEKTVSERLERLEAYLDSRPKEGCILDEEALSREHIYNPDSRYERKAS